MVWASLGLRGSHRAAFCSKRCEPAVAATGPILQIYLAQCRTEAKAEGKAVRVGGSAGGRDRSYFLMLEL